MIKHKAHTIISWPNPKQWPMEMSASGVFANFADGTNIMENEKQCLCVVQHDIEWNMYLAYDGEAKSHCIVTYWTDTFDMV